MKRTALYETHLKHSGKMVDFAGWEMPVQYEGLKAEHLAVRNGVGLFDVSHMGEIRVKGAKALETCEWLTTNHVAKLKAGEAQYTLFPNDQGGVVDDLIIYCIEPETDYLLCVNASNKDKDFQWCLSNNKGADITDESGMWGQIAIQGPKALEVSKKVFPELDLERPAFTFSYQGFNGDECIVARTGYTGEDGFEVFVPWDKSADLWQAFMDAGEGDGIKPCGLGARDTLRTEMKFPLYGNEIDDTTNPYQAGLGWVTKPKLKEFLGMNLILENKPNLDSKLIGLELTDKGIPRSGYEVLSPEGEVIGKVTSGTQSPMTGKSIGIAYVKESYKEVGTELMVQIRARQVAAKVVKTPFFER
ncbi:MAG: glycine cleavage system aminomethyltransferase GcvT [Pseudomonadota bacterium]